LDTLDGLDDLTVRESRLLHAVELLNEKILLLTTSLFREDYRGATASIGTSVVDVFFDPELGTYVWTVDGIERSVDWVRWFLEAE
ncbi:hypothetical protein LGN12_30970, partial [Burkholderia multivorans]|nr:hypothetical protein [Burkholderia multivorans]